MAKIINIAGKDVGFAAPASFPIRYRNMTGRDFFKDMQTLSESTDVQEKKPSVLKKLLDKKKPLDKDRAANEQGKPAEAKDEPEVSVSLNEKWDTTILFNLIHTMASACDPSITSDVIDWVDSFEEFPVFEIFTQLQPMLTKSMETTKK